MHRIAIGLLMLAYCLPAAYATLWADTARDLGASLTLARGEAIPLTGAPINFGPRSGPAWVWLQAIPLPFFPSFSAVAIFVAFVASFKFPLLYALGRRHSGPALGLAIAAAAAYPTFNTFQWIVFFHPNWVEVFVAASLLLFLLADQRRSLAMVYGAAAMLGLAVQMHATAVFYMPVALLVMHRIGIRGGRLAGHFAAMAMLVMAWFAPVVLAPPIERGAFADATGRVAADLARFAPASIVAALRNTYVDIPLAVGETYARTIPRGAWIGGLCVVWIAVIAGAFLSVRSRTTRFAFVAALCALIAGWVIAVAVRTYTSFYLVYFLLPLSAIVMGLALAGSLSSGPRATRAAGWTSIAVLVLSLFVTAYGARGIGRSGLIESRFLSMGDVSHPADASVRAAYMTAAARDALARDICRLGDSNVTLHGELAQAWSLSMGLDYRLHCPALARRLSTFGAGPGHHLTALPEAVAASLGVNAGRKERGMRLVDSVEPVFPRETRPIETAWYHFEVLQDPRALERVALDFETRPGQWVTVYRHKPYASRWQSFRVTRDGTAAPEAFTTFHSWIYVAGDRAARWHVEFETDAPQWTEVLLFPR